MKAICYSITKVSEANLYHWVPRAMTIRNNFEQDLIFHLEEKDFLNAHKVCFVLGITPTEGHELIAPGFREDYAQRYLYQLCSLPWLSSNA